MKRRDFMSQSASLGIVMAAASVPNVFAGNLLIPGTASKLTPPAKGKIPVAFAISDGVTVIDFAGPWEVFQDVMVADRGKDMDEQMPFELFTVSEKTEPLAGSGGLKLVPDYTFDSAPQPKVVVVPAQRGSQALHAWLRKCRLQQT
jgi:transcriptional regulator GlxA family with amidase domain